MSDLPSRPAGGMLAAPLLSTAVSALSWTWRVERSGAHLLDEAVSEGGTVLAFWHGEQLLMVPTHAGRGFLGLASLSRDGELLARTIARLGYGRIRGSTSRGGRAALHAAVQALRGGGCPALAVDGPRGPRHTPHPGALIMAARTQRPIIYGVARARPAVLLRSWDRFAVPIPFARVEIAYGRLEAPCDDQPETIEAARQALQERMRELSRDQRSTPQ